MQGNLYSVHDGRLVLNTRQTRQEYRLLILPAGKVISAETLKRIKEFYDKGGRILATGQLPVQSAEFGRDTEITALIGQIFGIDPTLPMPAKETSAANKQGGRTIFVPAVTRETLRTAIARLVPSPDVRIPLLADMKAPADSLGGPLGVLRDHPLTPEMLGMFSYIHKQKEGRDIYLFANSTNRPVDTWVEVRGKHRLDRWDPYTGEIVPWPETETVTNAAGEKYTPPAPDARSGTVGFCRKQIRLCLFPETGNQRPPTRFCRYQSTLCLFGLDTFVRYRQYAYGIRTNPRSRGLQKNPSTKDTGSGGTVYHFYFAATVFSR